MLTVHGLIKKYKDFEVLHGINFEIEKGSVYGFLGRNGAGKTTTMNIITGIIDFNEGDIIFDGNKFSENKRQILQNIGYVPQKPVFYGYFNAIEYLRFIGNLTGMTHNAISNRTEEVLKLVNLYNDKKRRIGGYSGGMKQRFAIAVAIFNNPKLLILDEPTSSLDPEGRMEILEFIRNLKDSGVTVFLSTHILNDIERVCDYVSIIDKGNILISEELMTLQDKFIKPVYDIEIEENIEVLSNELTELPYVQKCVLNGNVLSAYVSSIEEAKHDLINTLISKGYTIKSFLLRKCNLEDIFIRIIHESENV